MNRRSTHEMRGTDTDLGFDWTGHDISDLAVSISVLGFIVVQQESWSVKVKMPPGSSTLNSTPPPLGLLSQQHRCIDPIRPYQVRCVVLILILVPDCEWLGGESRGHLCSKGSRDKIRLPPVIYSMGESSTLRGSGTSRAHPST